MRPLITPHAELDMLAVDTGFSGVVRVDDEDGMVLERAFGLAHRGYGIANEPGTRFAIASGTKGLTALAVTSLVEEGSLELGTPARSLLGTDLPLVGDEVTVEHLLAHRSGIGDYLDEDDPELDVERYSLSLPVQALRATEDYVPVLDGHPPKFPPGERFAYSNAGYVVLALIAERAAAQPFRDLVRERVCERAGMSDSAFLRSDDLPGRVAIGYLENGRTNVFHLPLRGSGDGGIYSTAADLRALWMAFFAGRVVSPASVESMVRPRSDAPEHEKRYGLGFWLHRSSDVVLLTGVDAGVSFCSLHDPRTGMTCTVLSNTTGGAWPIARLLEERYLA